jgi:hypothetical protein
VATNKGIDYDALPTRIADYHGTTVSEWPGRFDDQRYTVLHPACGVNIHPTPDAGSACKKALRHSRKCSR